MHIAQRPAPSASLPLRVALALSLLLHSVVLVVFDRRPAAPAFMPRLSIELQREPSIAPEAAAVSKSEVNAQRPSRRASESRVSAPPEPAPSRPARETPGALNLRIPRQHLEAADVHPGRPLDALPERPGYGRARIDATVDERTREVAGGRALQLEQGCFLLFEGQSLSDEPLWWRRPCQGQGETAWRPVDPTSVHPSLRPR
jgi:hypothetical protein